MHSKIKQIIATILDVAVTDIRDDSTAQTLAKWDSINHMNIVLALECLKIKVRLNLIMISKWQKSINLMSQLKKKGKSRHLKI